MCIARYYKVIIIVAMLVKKKACLWRGEGNVKKLPSVLFMAEDMAFTQARPSALADILDLAPLTHQSSTTSLVHYCFDHLCPLGFGIGSLQCPLDITNYRSRLSYYSVLVACGLDSCSSSGGVFT